MKISTKLCRKMTVVAILWTLIVVGNLWAGTTYYVDFAEGADTNNGTEIGAPWKHAPGDSNATGKPASTILSPGSIVLFKGGVVYRGSISVNANGTADQRIVYKGNGWGTDKAILDGSEPLDGTWVKEPGDGNIYSIPAPPTYDFWNPLFETYSENNETKDEMLNFSQYPEPTDPFFFSNTDTFKTVPLTDSVSTMTRTSLVDPYFSQTASNFWNGSYILAWRVPNTISVVSTLSFDPNLNKLTYEDIGGDLYTDRDGKYSIINNISLINNDGEYAFQNGKIYARFHKPGVSTVSVGKREMGITIMDHNYVTVEGFIIQKYCGLKLRYNRGGGIAIGGYGNPPWLTHHIVVKDNEIRLTRSRERCPAIRAFNSDDVSIQGNSIHDVQYCFGMLIDKVTSVTVENNFVNRPGSSGIVFFGTTKGRILQNHVKNVLGIHSNGITAYLKCTDTLIARNIVDNAPYFSLTFQDSTNVYCLNNVLLGGNRPDTNRIGDFGGNQGSVVFLNNLIPYGQSHAALSIGNGGAERYVILNNIVDGGGWGSSVKGNVLHQYNFYTGLRWDQKTSGFGTGEALYPLDAIIEKRDEVNFVLKTVSSPSPAIRTGAGSGTDIEANVEKASKYYPQGVFPPDTDFTTGIDGVSLYTEKDGKQYWNIGPYGHIGSDVPSSPPEDRTVPAAPEGLTGHVTQ